MYMISVKKQFTLRLRHSDTYWEEKWKSEWIEFNINCSPSQYKERRQLHIQNVQSLARVVGVAWSKNIGPLRLIPEEAPPPPPHPHKKMQTQNKIGTCIEGGWFTIDPYVVA